MASRPVGGAAAAIANVKDCKKFRCSNSTTDPMAIRVHTTPASRNNSNTSGSSTSHWGRVTSAELDESAERRAGDAAGAGGLTGNLTGRRRGLPACVSEVLEN